MKLHTAKLFAGLFFVALGAWLILHGHPGGGWLVLAGVLVVADL